MTLPEFAALVREMREVQKQYRARRRHDPDVVLRAVEVERQVDEAIRDILGPAKQGGLF